MAFRLYYRLSILVSNLAAHLGLLGMFQRLQRMPAQWYDRVFAGHPDQWSQAAPERDRLFMGLFHRPDGRLLEIGCGAGRFLAQAEAGRWDTFGCDFSGEALQFARRRLTKARLVLCDGQALPFADGCFDIVMSIGSHEHFTDPRQGCREVGRTVRPDGKFYILVPTIRSHWEGWGPEATRTHGSRQWQWNLRESTWLRLLAESGLRVEQVSHDWKAIFIGTGQAS